MYDPNNPQSKKYEKTHQREKTREEQEEEDQEEESGVASKDTFVRTTFDTLFKSASAANFSFLGEALPKSSIPAFSFGFGGGEGKTAQTAAEARAKRKREEAEVAAAKKTEANKMAETPEETRRKLQNTPLFFFHLEHPDRKGCGTRLAVIDKFARTEPMSPLSFFFNSVP